jgi:hypothetical protein
VTVHDLKAGPMRRNLTYGLLVLFMLFLITANPSGTGTNGREFITWLSQGWDDTRAFVTSLVEEAEDGEVDGADTAPTPVPIATPTPLPTPVPTVAPDSSGVSTVE